MNAETGPLVQAPPAGAEIVDFSALLATLWRARLRLLMAALLGGVLGAAWLAFLAVPGYRASAMVVLQAGGEPMPDLSAVLPGLGADSSAVNTEIEILRARSLLARVVERLALDRDPEFNPALRPPGPVERLRDRALAPIADRLPFRLPDWLGARPGGAGVATDALADRLVVRSIPDSMVLEVMVETGAAEKSVRIVDTLTALYIEDQIAARFRAAEQAALWLEGRVGELKLAFERAEARARSFAADSDLLGPETLAAQERRLKDLRARLAEARAALDGAQPGAGRARLEQRKQALAEAVAELEARLDRQSADLMVLEQLQREAEASRRVYELFLSRLKETVGQLGIQQAESRVLSPAALPEMPSSPRPKLALTFSAALGLAFGMVLVLVAESRDLRYRSAARLEADTGLRVLGQLPRFRRAGRAAMLARLGNRPTAPEAEAVRNLRTALLAGSGKEMRLLAITSSLPEEGKTSLALALAQSVAGMGRRVLLVEADLRRPGLSALPGARQSPGLIALIGGDAALKAAVIRPAGADFDLLPAGPAPAGASIGDLFGAPGFANLLRQLAPRHDLVIFDTPPVLAVSDALSIGRQVDALLFAVRWGATGRESLMGGLRLLRNAGLRPAGLVLTRIGEGGPSYGPGHCYGGEYR